MTARPWCSWCGADLVRITRGVVEPHKVVEADANLCPGSGKPPEHLHPQGAWIETPDGLIKCPRCYPKARTA